MGERCVHAGKVRSRSRGERRTPRSRLPPQATRARAARRSDSEASERPGPAAASPPASRSLFPAPVPIIARPLRRVPRSTAPGVGSTARSRSARRTHTSTPVVSPRPPSAPGHAPNAYSGAGPISTRSVVVRTSETVFVLCIRGGVGLGWWCGVGLVVWGVVIFGVAHGRLGPLWGAGWFLLELRASVMNIVCGARAPMCSEGGLRTWEPNRGHYRHCCSA